MSNDLFGREVARGGRKNTLPYFDLDARNEVANQYISPLEIIYGEDMAPEMPDIPGLKMPETDMEFFDPYDDMPDVDYAVAPSPLDLIYGEDLPPVPPMMIPGYMKAPTPVLVTNPAGGPPLVMMMPPFGGPLIPYQAP